MAPILCRACFGQGGVQLLGLRGLRRVVIHHGLVVCNLVCGDGPSVGSHVLHKILKESVVARRVLCEVPFLGNLQLFGCPRLEVFHQLPLHACVCVLFPRLHQRHSFDALVVVEPTVHGIEHAVRVLKERHHPLDTVDTHRVDADVSRVHEVAFADVLRRTVPAPTGPPLLLFYPVEQARHDAAWAGEVEVVCEVEIKPQKRPLDVDVETCRCRSKRVAGHHAPASTSAVVHVLATHRWGSAGMPHCKRRPTTQAPKKKHTQTTAPAMLAACMWLVWPHAIFHTQQGAITCPLSVSHEG